MKFKKPYDAHVRQKKMFIPDTGLTIQEQAEQTDINNILEKYARTGLIEHVQKNEARYGEFAQFDFQANQNKIIEIQDMFDELPANVKQEFDYDVQGFLDHVSEQINIDDMKDGEIDNEIKEKPAEQPAEKPAEKPAQQEAKAE